MIWQYSIECWNFLLLHVYDIMVFFQDSFTNTILVSSGWYIEKWKRLSVDAPPPTSCPLCQCFCRKMSWCKVTTSWHDVTWRFDVVAWRHVTLWSHGMTSDDVMTEYTKKLRKSRFSIWWPWPLALTFKLIRDIIKVNASTKFWVSTSNGSAVSALTYRQTHIHTRDRFHTLDHWREREKYGIYSVKGVKFHYCQNRHEHEG